MARLLSEDNILSVIDRHFPRQESALRLGRGDDCAEFAPRGVQAISTDLFIEDVHFRRSYFLPEEIGHKALAVNLSDLASAGAVPVAFSLGLILPENTDANWLDAMLGGMSALARKHGAELSGGDLSAGDRLGLCITVWGESVAASDRNCDVINTDKDIFLRRGAREGQLIFILGPKTADITEAGRDYCALGLARLGLQQLENHGRSALAAWPRACACLLAPQPQLAGGQILAGLAAQWGRPSLPPIFLMDLSDGLARDLPRLLKGQGGTAPGAELDFDPAILHPELHRAGAGCGNVSFALETALSGGDDYLLLGAADAGYLAEFSTLSGKSAGNLRLDVLGRVSASSGIRWQGQALSEVLRASAFDHFG